MRKIDYHLHTHFSFDSNADPREHIKEALNKNLDEICFTDHRDFNYPIDPFELDTVSYFKELKDLQKEYQDKISIKIGLEIGLDMNHFKEINDFVNADDYDFVIGSIHVIRNTDFYYGEYFNNKTKDQAHREFFMETLRCVKSFDCFNVLGHMDYISRYGPYEDKSIDYPKYKDLIDQILKTLIQKNKGIEVNTSGYKVNGNCGFPSFDIVRRYKALGGSVITVGSDAHTGERVGEHIEEVIKEYQKIGFEDVTTFSKRMQD
ncbi:histidinol-phosphatase HisJ family protein [Eggerthia catenaformis]|uniref:histidinol-phosphatase HisJ family protein n=1 Tax=Eggerthia catenaformis TaxID=31973 RepID=UPI0028E1E120|nr:histidinol-phosphatase HisJ family protein [Eggerthia catenaformis]